jgi:hypothetical protein
MLILAGLCGCATSSPPAPQPLSTHAAPAATEAQAPPTTLELARRGGYTARQVNGKTLYCKTVSASGSRLQRETVCVTDEELKAAQAFGTHEASKMQRTNVPISPGG